MLSENLRFRLNSQSIFITIAAGLLAYLTLFPLAR